ncbi:MAG: hypothetical protein LC102_03540 [Ignavibacteriales bacterium]|nr:MAG: hypothetical protein F9K26_07145 [Ignavibacteriaceae bacterium]MBV6445368.1 hypothetical protein [Ignavibacteriaceae bacterium]MBZ0196449.1 hypothetical protein [Ignavibacteriaceae bacterium]MCZ2142487.1 hypothetical protein [Ignavibacteriales bacterium]OQY76173.1 MAG: hypothetical protein B6D45_04375 [Ignavibacteriales bacterium UTCHB3]
MNESPVRSISGVLQKIPYPASIFALLGNLIFVFLPISRYFSYEAAVLNAILLTYLSGLVYLNSFAESSTDQSRLKNFAINTGLLILIPVIVYFLFYLLRGGFGFASGLKYYLLFSATAPIVGSAIAAVVLLTKVEAKRIFFTIFFLILLFSWFIDFYYYHQFFLYNAIFTWYPGVIYDEYVPLTGSIILYRFVILLLSGVAIAVEFYQRYRVKEENRKKIGWLFVFVLPVVSLLLSAPLGLVTNESALYEGFQKSITTQHFVIHSEVPLSNSEQTLVARMHELSYKNLARFFGTKPRQKLVSVIFKDNPSKKARLGVENADITKPWKRTMFTTIDNLERTLTHEMAHLFAAEFGTGLFDIAAGFDPGLTEGAATAADGFIAGYFVDDFMSAVQRSKYKVNPNDVFPGMSFFSVNPTLAYALSGSVCRFIIDQYSSSKFKRFYSSGSAENAFGVDIAQILEKWEKNIETADSTLTEKTLDFYLQTEPFINKIAPRYIAELTEKAKQHFQNKEYAEAYNAFTEVYNLNFSPAAFEARVVLLMLLNKGEEARKVLAEFGKEEHSYAILTRYRLLKYQVESLLGDKKEADSIAVLLSEPETPLFVTSELKLLKLLLGKKEDTFKYFTSAPEEKLKVILNYTDKGNDSTAISEVVNLCYYNRLPFADYKYYRRYLHRLSHSGLLKLATILIREDKTEEAKSLMMLIDTKRLNFAQERQKYRIFRAVLNI